MLFLYPEIESHTIAKLAERKKEITFGKITGDMSFAKGKNPFRRLQILFAALNAHYIYDKVTGKSSDIDQAVQNKTPEKGEESQQEAEELYKHMPPELENHMPLPQEPVLPEKTEEDSHPNSPKWDIELINQESEEQNNQSIAGADPNTPETVTGMYGKPCIPPSAKTREKEYPLDDLKNTHPPNVKKRDSQAPLPSQPLAPEHQRTPGTTGNRSFFHWLIDLLKKAFSILRNIFT
ncbi:hypothetical protein ES705_11553 [subsurface metagenome]